MKILITLFKRPSYGGIANYCETLAKGLKELGHEVDAIKFNNTGETGEPKRKDRTGEKPWEFGSGLGLWMNQGIGWDGMKVLNYKKDLFSWKNICEEYDLVLHNIPVPTCNKFMRGDNDWLKLFDYPKRQILVVHNGNAEKSYPHMLEVCDKVDGIICVHESSYFACSNFPVRRKLIPNPHDIEGGKLKLIEERNDAIASIQTIRGCKRVDKFLRLIPYLENITPIICGKGIEYHYMTSITKVKPQYLYENGDKIWDVAVANGMEHRGVVDAVERTEILSNSKLFLDFSYSATHNSHGCVFNRTMIEAMIQGCVPVMSDVTMQGSTLFTENKNYLTVPYDAVPEVQAQTLQEIMKDTETLQRIQLNNYQKIKQFDKPIIAKQVLDFAFSEHGTIGKASEEFKERARIKMEHFNIG